MTVLLVYQTRNGHGRAQITCQNQTILQVSFLAASKGDPMLTAVVGHERLYWRGTTGAGPVLRLHSVSLKEPTAIRDYDLGVPWSRSLPIAWHMRDNEIWTLTGFMLGSPFEDYLLARSTLTFSKSNVIPITEDVIARCGPLERLRNDLKTQKRTTVFFDFYPSLRAG
jgi:hypothetical protein